MKYLRQANFRKKKRFIKAIVLKAENPNSMAQANKDHTPLGCIVS
jgi:hypothetical protein